MSLNDVINWVSDVVRQHEGWAIPIIFFLAFGESLAFLSLLLPATVILLALGALIGESGIAFWPIWAAAAVGAFFGDWLSYWIGYHYQDRVAHMWPLSRNPQLLARGHAFFERWGVLGIFIGRFFRPAARRGAAGGRHLRHAAALFPVSQRHVGDDLGVRHSGAGGIRHQVAQPVAGLISR